MMLLAFKKNVQIQSTVSSNLSAAFFLYLILKIVLVQF